MVEERHKRNVRGQRAGKVTLTRRVKQARLEHELEGLFLFLHLGERGQRNREVDLRTLESKLA